MDIDDILREVDPTFHAIPREKRDLQELTRAWIAERCAPELLPCVLQSFRGVLWSTPSQHNTR